MSGKEARKVVNDLDLNDYRNEYLLPPFLYFLSFSQPSRYLFPMPAVLEKYFLSQLSEPSNIVVLLTPLFS